MKTRTWKVQSHTNPADHYYVAEWNGGRLTCSCPHFTHRLAGGGECKHILDVKAGKSSTTLIEDFRSKAPLALRLVFALTHKFSF